MDAFLSGLGKAAAVATLGTAAVMVSLEAADEANPTGRFAAAQPGDDPPAPPDRRREGGRFPGGFGPGGFPGGGPMGREVKLVEKFDKDGDGRLNADERAAAKTAVQEERSRGGRGGFGGPGGGPGGPGGFGGRGRGGEPPKPGVKVSPADVANYPDAPLYAPEVLRTLFLDFDVPTWEADMAAFKDTDVEMPATLTVDGKVYTNVGVHFRGASSFGMVPEGRKRSLNISLDYVDEKQRLYGYKTLNLLNSNGDPSFLHSVLTARIAAEQGIPAPKANLVRVVINGEDWGIYPSVQQFNKELLAENFKNTKGSRWKVPGSPGGGGGLDYLGEDVAAYERRYELKTDDGDKAWPALIKLCKTLDETPPETLEEALAPMLDIDGVLKFLALDVALVNEDGYWVRASDYSLFLDKDGKFHVLPHDMNETFHSGGGPGMGGPPGMAGRGGPGGFGPPGERPRFDPQGGERPEGFGPPGERPEGVGRPGDRPRPDGFGPPEGGPRPEGFRPEGGPRPEGFGRDGGRGRGRFGGPGGGPGGPGGRMGVDLDPLVSIDDPRKPLRSKLLAVPALKERYLRYVHDIAEKSLDWNRLGPVVDQYASLIDAEVKIDTRQLGSYDAFLLAVGRAEVPPVEPAAAGGPGGRGGPMSLKSFVEQRRTFLLNHPEVKKSAPTE